MYMPCINQGFGRTSYSSTGYQHTNVTLFHQQFGREKAFLHTLSVFGTFFSHVLSASPMNTTDGCKFLPTFITMCINICRPLFPGYFPAMFAAVRSNKLAPVSVQMALIKLRLPVPRGPARSIDLIRGAFSWTAWEPVET